MSDIFFLCENCGQSLDAPKDMGGEEINCPVCGEMVEIPQESTIPEPPLDEIEEQEQDLPTRDEVEEEKKKSTVKMHLPEDGAVYRPPRKVTIKRADDGHDSCTQKDDFALREKKKGIMGRFFSD